uniref:Uncharacterized protein n=1 Tax=Eutreptiella gymnastica TaxID=73025 RepID=A0A7S1IGK8_9EUGL|mmetsp:Transcript_15872/g.28114  ORF Transcript_15872/g.28114 Transcript_15872/m.28114 type:complete len:320 (+) Transcript_15872:89-1048(+)
MAPKKGGKTGPAPGEVEKVKVVRPPTHVDMEYDERLKDMEHLRQREQKWIQRTDDCLTRANALIRKGEEITQEKEERDQALKQVQQRFADLVAMSPEERVAAANKAKVAKPAAKPAAGRRLSTASVSSDAQRKRMEWDNTVDALTKVFNRPQRTLKASSKKKAQSPQADEARMSQPPSPCASTPGSRRGSAQTEAEENRRLKFLGEQIPCPEGVPQDLFLQTLELRLARLAAEEAITEHAKTKEEHRKREADLQKMEDVNGYAITAVKYEIQQMEAKLTELRRLIAEEDQKYEDALRVSTSAAGHVQAEQHSARVHVLA